jgi:hypothetical protein
MKVSVRDIRRTVSHSVFAMWVQSVGLTKSNAKARASIGDTVVPTTNKLAHTAKEGISLSFIDSGKSNGDSKPRHSL